MPLLSEIEQEVSRRLGPFHALTASSVTASTQTLVYADELQTTVEAGGYDGLYLLRRSAALAADRVRMVASYDPAGGSLEVDRPYTNQPAGGEAFELMALHPSHQVRVAVQRGLDRCFVGDRVVVPSPTAAAERDLTAALPWLTRREQVLGVSWLESGSVYAPSPVDWWRSLAKGGRLWLAASPDPAPNSLYVDALRPVSSRVNGLSAPSAPTVTDLTTGGNLLANTVYYVAVAVDTPYGTSPASTLVRVRTANDGVNTHALRVYVPQQADASLYRLYVLALNPPLRVANVTEAQRLAGVTITAQDTVSATSPGAGYVDLRVVGASSAAVQAAPPSSDTDVLDVPLDYAATAAHQYAWEAFTEFLRPVASTGMTLGKDEVQAAWTKWVNRLPKPPDRLELSYPYPAWEPA